MDTRITAVTVYEDRAQVTRDGKETFDTGLREIVVAGLPIVLEEASVRAKVRATAGCRLLGTQVDRDFSPVPTEEKVAALQSELDALRDRETALAKQLDTIALRRAFLNTLATNSGEQLARGIALGRSSLETGADLVQFLSQQNENLDGAHLQLIQDQRTLKREIDTKARELDSLQRIRPTESRSVRVLLDLVEPAEVELALRYQVTGARWEPLYDLRVRDADGVPELSLTRQAQVTQQTGEEWEGVALSLSTARPALAAVLPELDPWFLYVPEPPRPKAAARRRLTEDFEEDAMPRMAALAMVAEPAQAPPAPPMAEAVVQTATIEEAGPAVTFKIGGGSGIPSDGSPHKVTLGDGELTGRLDYVTAPRITLQAYLRARVKNVGAAVLLPGPVQLFHEDEYVGTTRIKTTAPGEEFDVYLGIDDRIKVERKLVEGAVDKKLLQDIRRMTYAYEIKLTNLRSTRASITVLDQLPLSRHEGIKIRKGDIRPAPTEETEMGRLKWELSLAAGETQTVRFAFAIEAQRSINVAGLPPLKEPA
jgi:uncharacterized protein (TIGR02231 family)